MILKEIYPPHGRDISMVTETDEEPVLSLSHAYEYDAGSPGRVCQSAAGTEVGAVPATTISVGIQLSFRSGSEPTVFVTTTIYRHYAGISWTQQQCWNARQHSVIRERETGSRNALCPQQQQLYSRWEHTFSEAPRAPVADW